jgi:Ca2+-binding RTX toxin-like protein
LPSCNLRPIECLYTLGEAGREKETGMGRMAMVLTAVALMVVLSAGVAVAASITGTQDRDVLDGSGKNETISGLGGPDTLNGSGGRDTVKGGDGGDEAGGGAGADEVYGGPGDDYLIDAPDNYRDVLHGNSGEDNVQVRDFPAVKDVVYCGSGRDTSYVDRLDVVHDCEVVLLP